MMPRRAHLPRQRGFALIVVLLLVLAMAGTSATILANTQADLQVAGTDREATVALYAAEAAVAFGKDWIAGRVDVGESASSILASGAAPLCQPACAGVNCLTPGIAPRAAQPEVDYDPRRQARYRFCVHNNAYDPNYGVATPTGDTSDSDGILTIEGYGFGPNGAASRIVADVRVGTGDAPAGGEYAQSGGGPSKHATGEALSNVAPNQTSF